MQNDALRHFIYVASGSSQSAPSQGFVQQWKPGSMTAVQRKGVNQVPNIPTSCRWRLTIRNETSVLSAGSSPHAVSNPRLR